MNHDQLLLAVIGEYPGTPEELGSTLFDALDTPWTWATPENERRSRERIHTARLRILKCEHGAEMLEAEEQLMVGAK